MPHVERFGIGSKIDWLFLEMLDGLRKATYAPLHEKIACLESIIKTIDGLRFFLQLSWEISLIHTTRYTVLAKEVEEVGRMVGGWRKGLLTKTSATNAEERKG